MSIGLALLLLVIGWAVITDLTASKVSNKLIAVGFAGAFFFNLSAGNGQGVLSPAGGSIGLLAMASGVAVSFAALFPLYALRAMGAGDVKLMMVVGAFLGPLQTLGAVVLTFVAGGVLALVMAIWQRSLSRMLINLRFMLITGMVRAAGGDSPRLEPLQHTAGRMPYAVAIAAGTVLQLVLVRSGGWALS
ncbi:prepilin peptidase [Thauera chlorobenzoica]|uniref:Type IV prepilin peptidase TadV/CpaA n=1 Tax=Thauera chlorobenzoica TaxID=96773 RepID=A0A1H5XUF9_9RHOO|nr:prepilin peptidase [Thauera chlorobenzoica]APR04576.1 Type IV prepilin peptidase TadV/CpaA [Thauera chlorobenzoica]SEG14906.1 prepilin peptidase CpaA [Thauera chlorobenzoica]